MLSERSDVTLVQLASRSYFKEMLRTGVKIYLYRKVSACEMMVFDDSLTLIGSANFDSRSFAQNFEVEAFIYDDQLANQAENIFVEDQRNSEVISLREWLKRL